MADDSPFIRWFATLRRTDVSVVGGKNASLGEMIGSLGDAGIRVPDGFATTAHAFWTFIAANRLREPLAEQLGRLEGEPESLAAVGAAVRKLMLDAEMPAAVGEAILAAYRELGRRRGGRMPSVAVRSSATAEDLPEASFAGQLETFLNIRGDEALLQACRRCFASLFTDRAIAYRRSHGFGQTDIALSVGVQEMVRADLAGAGVMFSIDTETGFPRSVLVTAAYGLGETVVQGIVDPDEYHVFKPMLGDTARQPIIEKSLGGKARKMVLAKDGERPAKLVDTPRRQRDRFVLTDDEVLQLARWSCAIERHYGQAMDMEWAKDGKTGALYVVQARPETVQSRRDAGTLSTYVLRQAGGHRY